MFRRNPWILPGNYKTVPFTRPKSQTYCKPIVRKSPDEVKSGTMDSQF